MKNLAIAILTLFPLLQSFAQNTLYTRTIEVSAKVSKSILPQSADMALTIYSSSVDGTKNIPVEQTEIALRKELNKLGIKDGDFFSTSPVNNEDPSMKVYTLRLRNFELWPKITAKFDNDLIENIYTIKSDIPASQKADLEKELTKDALAIARERADYLAQQIPAKIKRIYSIRSSSPFLSTLGVKGEEGNIGAVQTAPGESTMELEIQVTFEIE